MTPPSLTSMTPTPDLILLRFKAVDLFLCVDANDARVRLKRIVSCVSCRSPPSPFSVGLTLLRCRNNSNSNSHDIVYGAVIVAMHCHCESSPGSSDECSTQRQVAADLWTKPSSLSQ